MESDDNELGIPEQGAISQSSEKKIRGQFPDRLKIGSEALSKLNLLIEQANQRLRGMKLTRSDLVNFLILKRSETLSTQELKELETQYFDELKFAQWAIQELKAARSKGESITLGDILSGKSDRSGALNPSKRKSKKGAKEAPPSVVSEDSNVRTG
ncbi:MAG: hypothetical protein HYX41_07105 [Bdellovibrio sp.]|nr:hypothetical protein [Bdellovibrio sp.]